MNFEATSLRPEVSSRQSYARSVSRVLAQSFAVPLLILAAGALASLLLALAWDAPAAAVAAFLAGCAAAAVSFYLTTIRLGSDLATPADALLGAVPVDAQEALGEASLGGSGSLAQIRLEFSGLAGALAERLSRDAQLAGELARAKEDAQSSNIAKSQFLADMSHQLRTPLNAVIGYATLLQEDALAAGRREELDDLDRILQASRTLLELINYVIELSRIEAGKTSLQRGILDIASLVSGVSSGFDMKAQGNGNTLRIDVEPEIGIMVGDGAKIRQCLINLIANAVKFTHNGVVRLKVKAVRRANSDMIAFAVSDDGIGMTAEEATTLFQDNGTDPESLLGTGSGPKLGLAITHRLVTLMGGGISAESAPGKGTVFTLTIPREMPRTLVSEDALPFVEKHVHGKSAAGRRALIIDDEPSAIDIASRWLARLGYTVISASNGDEGLELARREKPDLIILDIFMPGRSGHEILEAIRADESIAAIPVIVMTVMDDRSSVLKSGASDCLMKPVQPQQLERVLDVYSKRLEGEILVIEDDPDSGAIIRRAAAQIGLTARVARNGEEGLAMIREKAPAAIVLDLSLPGISGFQVLEKLSEDPDLKAIPVIIVSGREISVLEHQVITRAGGIFHPKGHSSPREIAQSLRMVVGS